MPFLNKIKKLIPTKLFKALQPAYHFLMAGFSALVFRFPSEKLIVIGITGTTGKTTSVYLIAKTLEAAGFKVGYTSTAMFNDGKKEWLNDKKMTMVGRFFTQKILGDMVKNGCQYAIVETTSEGIRQFRHRFINYDVLVFTGLYPEHIESHGSFDKYKEAKGKLFAYLKKCGHKYADENKQIHRQISGLKKTELNRVKKTIIANLNDEHADYFLNFWADEKIGYKQLDQKGVEPKANQAIERIISYYDIHLSGKGTSFKIENKKIQLKLLGEFNVANAMNAVGVALNQNVSLEKIKIGLEGIEGVAGRLELIDEGQNYIIIVDYAFEPRAVSKLYEAVKLIPHNKIIHVLGSAGGGRDAARRPILGKIAGANSDIAIITNEDPYDENPEEIINQVVSGTQQAGKKLSENLFKILDRREAIKKALNMAEESDVVLITGKGSEQAICVADGEKISWDDRAIVRGILNENIKK